MKTKTARVHLALEPLKSLALRFIELGLPQ